MKVFKEEQRFTQPWLLVVLGFSLLVPIYVISKNYMSENSEMTTSELIFSLGGIIVITLFIFFFKLTTRIDEKGIYYQFFPFHLKLKLIAWQEITSANVRTYDAITEYGGWGLKGGFFWNKAKGTAINVSGDIGIQLTLKNGKKLLIGTQKENDAKSVLETYKSKIN